MVFFVDSNFFLQCKTYKDIDWADVTTDDIIEIYISRPVQIEIDRLKSDGNTRRAKRARSTNSFFRQILLGHAIQLSDQVGGKQIVFRFAKHYSRTQLVLSGYEGDLSNPDDEIIACLAAFIHEENEENAFLLTHDTNPLLSAKIANIPAKAIPDGWLLPPENDERDKLIITLQKEIRDLKYREPDILFAFEIDKMRFDGAAPSVTIRKAREITDDELKDFVDSLVQKRPPKSDFSSDLQKKDPDVLAPLGMRREYVPPTKEEIEKYQNELYPEWLEEARRKVAGYRSYFNSYHRAKPFRVLLWNEGNSPVENLILRFETVNPNMAGTLMVLCGNNAAYRSSL